MKRIISTLAFLFILLNLVANTSTSDSINIQKKDSIIAGQQGSADLVSKLIDKEEALLPTPATDAPHLLQQILTAALIVGALILIFFLLKKLFQKIKISIEAYSSQKISALQIKEYEFLSVQQITKILLFIVTLIKWTIFIIILLLAIPILFSVFPHTKGIAITLINFILTPTKAIFSAIINYIPNIFFILIIWLSIHYLIKGIAFLAGEIESGKLKISGFYPDWAQPTYSILRILLYAFMIAMIYPYLPGSNSGIFQGISVFLGLIVSLGSTSVIGNVVAGLVITYMRPFKMGDRIKLNETVGNVIEKTAFVTRIRTLKNEVVTIPNSTILTSQSINYSSSAEQYGLILHTSVTIGYDAPWRKVHSLLIEAAKATSGIEQSPEPFVLEIQLNDFYIEYQINACTRDANSAPRIKSELHQHIQDKFNKAGVEIMSPHYRVNRLNNDSTIPNEESEPITK